MKKFHQNTKIDDMNELPYLQNYLLQKIKSQVFFFKQNNCSTKSDCPTLFNLGTKEKASFNFTPRCTLPVYHLNYLPSSYNFIIKHICLQMSLSLYISKTPNYCLNQSPTYFLYYVISVSTMASKFVRSVIIYRSPAELKY